MFLLCQCRSVSGALYCPGTAWADPFRYDEYEDEDEEEGLDGF